MVPQKTKTHRQSQLKSTTEVPVAPQNDFETPGQWPHKIGDLLPQHKRFRKSKHMYQLQRTGQELPAKIQRHQSI